MVGQIVVIATKHTTQQKLSGLPFGGSFYMENPNMAEIKIWYHDALLVDANSFSTPILNEPSIVENDLAEQVTTPAASNPAPKGTRFAYIETDADIRYTVRNPLPAAQTLATANHKKILTGQDGIALREGQTISFIDG